MILLSMLLVLAGLVTLLLGVAGFGAEPLRFVYASIAACLLAAVFLAAGVVRARPSRRPPRVEEHVRPTWSGAVHPSAGGDPQQRPQPGEPHVQLLPAHDGGAEAAPAAGTLPLDLAAEADPGEEAGVDLEHERFVQALAGLPLDRARLERLRGRFVTLEGLRDASAADLAAVPGISAAQAEVIAARLRDER